ncbi:serine hydrolase domain-containing protein [Solibacillus silvestris]|uniref:serine hydrolase domain-containing protein n=1 Tax=Solibacillus silvestris TaxID=76853 RepID=UPI003F80163E
MERIERLINNEYNNITGIVVLKNGNMEYEQYFNGYSQNDTVHIASVTKSITSALIGIAIDKGYISNVEQRVLDFFPDYKIKRGEKTIQNVTIKNLLTMTAPYKYKSEPYTKVYTSDDWTKAALDLLGGKGSIGEFKYTTVGMQILAGIIENATGQTVTDFADENLFGPLEIKVPHNKDINNKEEYLAFLKDKYVNGWVVDPKGVNTAGWGLALTTRDMASIGQLYLNNGLWKGKQIISSRWVKDSIKAKSSWGMLLFGYLWWIIDEGEYNGYAALGDGGNAVFVIPDKQYVIAIASSFMPRAKDRIELIRKYLIPLLDN